MIRAEVHTNNFRLQVRFDATKWFELASDQEIINLIECGFGGKYPSNRIAYFLSEYNAELANFFDCFRRDVMMRGGNRVRFECHINGDDAENWIKTRRPHLMKICA